MTQKQQAVIDQLQTYIAENGLQIVGERDIDYGVQFKLTDGVEDCVVSIYHTGKVVIGGKKTAFRQQMEEWKNLLRAAAQGLVPQPSAGGSAGRARQDVVAPFVPHIGADEAGKGDYFGPLVAAAVYVTAEAALDLIRWGVADSKSIGQTIIPDLALKIRERCPGLVHILMPPDYNQAYKRHQNLNRLLAELHTTVIGELAAQTGCQEVWVDQFAAPDILAKTVTQRGVAVNLKQHTQGEADVAIAAASILAREGFVAAVEDYRVKAGMEIPLGASSPQVVEIGRAIVRKWGRKGLERIAKIDFKTTQKILGKRP